MILYKYTNINENFFDMVEHEYFYCALSSEFDDIFDAKMPFDFKDNIEEITDEFVRDIILKEINFLIFQRGIVEFEKFNELLKNIDLSKIEIIDYNEYYDEESLENMNIYNRAQAILTTKKSIETLKKFIIDLIDYQKKIRVCCFSKKTQNQVLWSMYADQYKGCCIEYEIPDKLVKKVLYGERYSKDPLYAVIEYIVTDKKDTEYPDINNIVDLLILSKHKDWEFQDEYRVIDFKDKIPCKINCINLGYKVSEENEKKILEKCGKHKIKKMKIDYYNQKFNFISLN